VERKKPFPDIYLRAASHARVECRDCLVVEDAVNGIRAGIGAGARCMGITTSFSEAQLKEAGALWCAPDLSRALHPWEL
jgi:beta-phosphoglucomutase-like phosphatase (HAD superfamily)